MPLLLYLVTEDSYFLSHRLPMARAAKDAGFDVAVIANPSEARQKIEAEGIRVIPLAWKRRSLNPFGALVDIFRIYKIYRAEKPRAVHQIAMKPIFFGSIAAWLSGVPRVINAFAGLGFVFTSDGAKAKILRLILAPLGRVFLKRGNSYLLMQNDDDLILLHKYNMVPKGRVEVIRGSGVDLDKCRVQKWRDPAPDFICAFSGRMISIKGLATMKDAFDALKSRASHIKLWLCGTPDDGNPESWNADDLRAWEKENPNVVWKGYCKDMTAIWAQAHCALQPSWGGEGVPKALLEAGACGRAIVATDVPGCREVVHEGINGFLVPARDANSLARVIFDLASDPQKCAEMGQNSRKIVEEEGFSARAVQARTAALYREWTAGF